MQRRDLRDLKGRGPWAVASERGSSSATMHWSSSRYGNVSLYTLVSWVIEKWLWGHSVTPFTKVLYLNSVDLMLLSKNPTGSLWTCTAFFSILPPCYIHMVLPKTLGICLGVSITNIHLGFFYAVNVQGYICKINTVRPTLMYLKIIMLKRSRVSWTGMS